MPPARTHIVALDLLPCADVEGDCNAAFARNAGSALREYATARGASPMLRGGPPTAAHGATPSHGNTTSSFSLVALTPGRIAVLQRGGPVVPQTLQALASVTTAAAKAATTAVATSPAPALDTRSALAQLVHVCGVLVSDTATSASSGAGNLGGSSTAPAAPVTVTVVTQLEPGQAASDALAAALEGLQVLGVDVTFVSVVAFSRVEAEVGVGAGFGGAISGGPGSRGGATTFARWLQSKGLAGCARVQRILNDVTYFDRLRREWLADDMPRATVSIDFGAPAAATTLTAAPGTPSIAVTGTPGALTVDDGSGDGDILLDTISLDGSSDGGVGADTVTGSTTPGGVTIDSIQLGDIDMSTITLDDDGPEAGGTAASSSPLMVNIMPALLLEHIDSDSGPIHGSQLAAVQSVNLRTFDLSLLW